MFGLILLITSGLLKPENSESKSTDNPMIRLARALFRTSDPNPRLALSSTGVR